MNRKSFLKKLFAGAATAVVAPKLLLAKDDGNLPKYIKPELKYGKGQPPIVINISNPTDGELTCVLFGCNWFLLTSNFGSGNGLIIEPEIKDKKYIQLLNELANKPFNVGKTRIQSHNTKQLKQQMDIVKCPSNAPSKNYPVIAKNYFTTYMFKNGFIEIQYSYQANAQDYFYFKVLPKTDLSITFFDQAEDKYHQHPLISV